MPRKPKSVTPDDDLAELADAALATGRRPALVEYGRRQLEAALEEPELSPRDLESLALILRPAADQVRATVAQIALIPIARATPEERTQLVELREVLDRTRADLSTWVDAIDIGFRRAAAETGATEIVLADGIAKVDPPRGEWVVNVPTLQSELKQLTAHGLLSQEEYESIFTTKVEVVANNSRLNYFSSKRGQELAEAIARSRVWKDGNPANAKVRFQRRAD